MARRPFLCLMLVARAFYLLFLTPHPSTLMPSYTAKTVFGLEQVLAAELAALGAEDITPGRRLVDFSGDRRLLYKANIWLRTAIRVLWPVHQFDARDERELYAGVKEIDW